MSTRIDGPGLVKLETLESAVTLWQRLHAIVERMASAQRSQQSLAPFRQQIHRAATPLASLLKPQFEPVSDLVTALVIVSTRGGSDQARVRALQESVAQVKVHLEAAAARVRKQHTVEENAE
jgi:hypothetical protein